MVKIFLFVLILLFVLLQPATALAASTTKSTKQSSIMMSGVYIRPRNSVKVFLGNLIGVANVSYTLMYQGNGIGQGVEGTVIPGKKIIWTKDLYLGTCSSKVCLPHKNVKNIQLETIVKYKNGKTSTKTINIR